MAYKPRKQRLSSDKVREKLIAQEARLNRQRLKHESQQRERTKGTMLENMLTTTLVALVTKLHTGVQAAAVSNPVYRPLVGRDWYETLGRFADYTAALKSAGQAESLAQVWADLGISALDIIPFLALAMSYGSKSSGPPAC